MDIKPARSHGVECVGVHLPQRTKECVRGSETRAFKRD